MISVIIFVAAVTAGLVTTLVRARFNPKSRLIGYVVVSLTMPLGLFWLFLAHGYRNDSWTPFGYGSITPVVLAGLATLAILAVALARTAGSPIAKILVDAFSFALWLTFYMYGTILVACSFGDCL